MKKRKKHPCPDCNFCQFCAETRCRTCITQSSKKQTMTIDEQIELYKKWNFEQTSPEKPIFYRKK